MLQWRSCDYGSPASTSVLEGSFLLTAASPPRLASASTPVPRFSDNSAISFFSRSHFSQGSSIPYLLAVSREAMTRFIFSDKRSTLANDRVMSPLITMPLSRILSSISRRVSWRAGGAEGPGAIVCAGAKDPDLGKVFAWVHEPHRGSFHFAVRADPAVLEPVLGTKAFNVIFWNRL